MTATTRTENDTTASLTTLAQSPRTASMPETGDSIPFVIIEGNHKVQDLEKLLPTPTRKRGTTKVRDAASFVVLYLAHRTESSRIYGSVEPPRFEAVLDDHQKEAPGWREHRLVYDCPLSVEWKTWLGMNKKPMSQEQFAQFIEDNLPDVIEPAAADMLEISRTLEAKKKVNFASGIRLSNGQNELTYEEQVSGTAAKGKLQVPETFALAIPVMEGGARYRVTARLRYRIGDQGALAMWFDLERPHKIVEDAVQQVWTAIKTETGEPIVNGTPAS